MRIKLLFVLSLFLFITILVTPSVFAVEFDPNYIISNTQMLDKNTMSLDSIQSFLESRDSYLSTYKTKDFYNKTEKASTIIYNASQDYGINPQALLVLLQKEQSLVDNKNPKQYNLDWATGWHRPDNSDPNDPALQKRKGFGIQVDGAAGLIEWYFEQHDTPGYFLKKAGKTYIIDDTEVTPSNKATAALYNYTPHIHGNKNFQKIWNSYFSKTHLNGSLLQVDGEPGVWLLQSGKRRPFTSKLALITRYDPSLIIPISKSDLEKYPIGKEIKFAQYALLRTPLGDMYMIDGDTKRPIASMEAFKAIGFNQEEIEDIELDDLTNYSSGKAITAESVYPTGALVQSAVTGAVFNVVDGKKYGIVDKSILKIKFPNSKIIPTSEELLAEYKPAGFVKFDDGELVSPVENKAVYVIVNGRKRPILSGEDFVALGYKWSNIVSVPEKILNSLHRDGAALAINY